MKIKIALLFILVISQSILAIAVSGAEYRTKQSFKYGRFEVRMKAAKGSGIISSFFTYSDDSYNAGNWNEIDIEILGRYSDSVQFNYIIGPPKEKAEDSKMCFVAGNTNEEFHTYAFEWYPDAIVWYIDNKKARSPSDTVSNRTKQFLINPQKIMINIWASENIAWVGAFNQSSLPKYAYYDYVAYSSYNIQTGKFTPEWKDSLNSFDTLRWEKRTLTKEVMPNSYTYLYPTNIGFLDTTATLALTLKGGEGRFPTSVKNNKYAENKNKQMISADKNGLSIYSTVIGDGGTVSLYTTSGKLIKTIHLESQNNKVHFRWSEMGIRSNSVVYICKNQKRSISGVLSIPSL